ncbi:MAG: InlB B-repeat-containing protein [Prevotella sp.]|nr:InlB B-repeat-containing protein [Prevotella sp.]
MKKIFLSLLFSMAVILVYADSGKYKGDINGDGEITLSDMVKLASDMLNNAAYNSAHDLNGDKKIDDADLQELANIILNNIKSPQSGLDVGIGDWGDGGEFGGVVGAKHHVTAAGGCFSISDIRLDEEKGKYYFNVDLSGQDSKIYCSAIINVKLPQNISFSLDGNNNPVVECNAEGLITNGHGIYGKPTLQKDGSLRFIVFNSMLTDFNQAAGTIAKVYVSSQETEGIVTILPGELATSGNKGVGSNVTKTVEEAFDLKVINTHKITYIVDGETYKTVDMVFGEPVTPEAAPEKEGYAFSGWSEIPATMPAHDVTVTGTFAVNTYKLTYLVDSEVYKVVEYAFGETITPEAAPEKEGYTFSGWSEIPGTMPAHDVTVTGTFAVNTYKLTYLVDGEVYKVVEYAFGETITPEAAPAKEGYTFSGWSDIPATMPAHDVTVTGTFAVNTYKLTYLVDGEVYKVVEYAFGATITPEPAPEKEGYTFSGWSDIPATMPAHDVTVTGTFAVNTYKLTYLVDGEVYKVVEYAFGATITPEAAPAKEGYTFSGWSEISATMPAKNIIVTGTFTVNTYKLTYLVDGEVYKIVDMAFGATITPEAVPEKEGHTFSGWSDIPATMPAKDITVTGTFAINTYKLTYLVDGEVYKVVEYAFGATITPEPAPEKEGYTFSGWSEIPATMPAKNIIVTGSFGTTANIYKITYIIDGEVYKIVEVHFGETITPEAIPEKEGYTFSGWSDIPETMPAKNIIVTGTFTANIYKLTYLVDGEVYKVVEYAFGETITPEVAPVKEGYTFSGWSEIPEMMPAKNIIVAGTFDVNTYKLTYLVDGEIYKVVEYAFGELITPEAVPEKEGYTFSGWSDIPETMPAKDITVTGTFTVNTYKLTYLVDGEVYKVVDMAFGATITPEAAPAKEGYTFSGWSDIPETMPAGDITVTGTFAVNIYKLTYLVDGEVYKVVEYAFGETITPEAAPAKEGYTFSGWSDIPETMPAMDITVTGTFKIDTSINDILSSDRKVNVYNLNGRKLYEQKSLSEALKQLPKGIYIINGQKIRVK